jgi:aquaporin Z
VTSAAREGSEPERVVWFRRLLSESFGTFALTFVAAGADTTATLSGGEIGAAARAVAPALLVMALIYALGDVSGAHFNPAVSLAFALRGLFPPSWLARYWGAQLAGALAAALVLRGLFGSAADAGVSAPHVASGVALAIEVILTGFLITMILGTADRHRVIGPNAALAVGGTIALCGLIALPIEGASMNPARSFGPAVAAMNLADLWIYWLGPAIGALLAVGLTRALHGPPPRDGDAADAAQGRSEGRDAR